MLLFPTSDWDATFEIVDVRQAETVAKQERNWHKSKKIRGIGGN